uniref:Uncharacterized protein n=1 Tax=Panagrolaimus sp. JU765 TaxID=591449 RepID=A0AC34QF22_9BILA
MDHDEWLKDIGISPRSTLGFGRHATISDFSLHKTMSNLSPDDDLNGSIENTNEAAKSTALITDFESIQKFVNFLMKSKEFRTNVGQQGGLPPTIIATDSFTNCTMKFLQQTSQVVKRQDQGNKLEYVLEMDGG